MKKRKNPLKPGPQPDGGYILDCSPTAPYKMRPDAAEIAYRTMLEATGQAPKTSPPTERADEEKHPAAVERGRVGGKRGGTARAEALSAGDLKEAAALAATARWKKGSKGRRL